MRRWTAELALAARALAVQRPGEYLGLFDWLIWGDCRRRRVLMLFGTHAVDLRGVLAPDLPAMDDAPVTRVVATARSGTGRLLTPAGFGAGGVNHFVIGHCGGAAPAAAPGDDDEVPSGSCARAAAARVHWLTLPTNATGECGPDCMAFSVGSSRTAAGWQAIRQEIANHVLVKQGEAVWQDIFRCCGEDVAVARPVPHRGLSVAMAGAYASAAVLLPGCAATASAANLARAASAKVNQVPGLGRCELQVVVSADATCPARLPSEEEPLLGPGPHLHEPPPPALGQ